MPDGMFKHVLWDGEQDKIKRPQIMDQFVTWILI